MIFFALHIRATKNQRPLETKMVPDKMNRSDHEKADSMDTPDCFGEFSKTHRMCQTYCALSIQCCLMRSIHPKIGLFEKLLIHNQYAPKPH
jgi:hypothetical protein